MSFLRIAHLSDPHFGTILPGVEEGLLATLSALKPHLILITGDITQRARRSQFQAAKEFTHRLQPTPFIAVPGNHDIPLFNVWGRVFHPYRKFKRLFKDQLERDFIHGDVLVTGLNSTSRWRHIQGRLRLSRLTQRLRVIEKSRVKVHIAALHHPLDCAKVQDEKNLLRGAAQTMDIFAQNGIDLVVSGHIHDPYVSLSKVRYPQTPRSMVLSVAGTCTSWRTRVNAPNSFHLVEINTDSVPALRLVRYDQGADLRFAIKTEHRFHRPDSTGWVVQ